MSFVTWAAELESAEVPSDADGLAEAVACHDRYTAKSALALAGFKASGDWDLDGSTSMVAWLRDRGMTRANAAELVGLADKLRHLPVTAAAWVTGALSGGQVQVIAALVIDRHIDLFASRESDLVPSFAGLSVADTAVAMRTWRAKADALDEGPEPRDPGCEARLSPTLDDRGVLTASLDAEGHALAAAALQLADSNDFDVPAPQRRGQALKDIFRWFLDHQQSKTGGRHRPHLNIVIKGETIGTEHVEGHDAVSGMRLDSRTLERLIPRPALPLPRL